MSNPYAVFGASDDEEDSKVVVVKKDQKPKLTHAEKKAYKKKKEQDQKKAAEIAKSAPVQENLPAKTKESHKYPHMERQKKQWKQKQVPAGHTHDRRSGTGREDRPRKAGGGYGNVGNAKDMQHQQKYVKEGEEKPEEKPVEEEQPTEPVEQKEPQPEKLTLEEYYKAKGVEVSYQQKEKAPVKKDDIKAEWIKKEKLTLMTTKEDLRANEKKAQQSIVQNTTKSGLNIDESDYDKVGFGSKPAPKEAPRQEEHQKGGRRGKKANRPQFSADDFPSL